MRSQHSSTFILPPLARDGTLPCLLGFLHRTTLGKGLAQFRAFFKKNPCSKDLHDPRKDFNAPITKRSALGLVAVYNMLPPGVLVAKSVSAFQRGLQECVVKFALSGYPQWAEVFSPRIPLVSHPIRIHSEIMASTV